MNGRIKILHLHTLTVISGSGINTLITMQGLKKSGYEIEFASRPGGGLEDEVKKNGFRFRPVKYFRQEVNIACDLMALLELIALIRNGKYTIVHTHNSKAGFLGRLAAAICGVPVVVHTIHGFSFHDNENAIRKALFIFLERSAARFSDRLIAVSTPLKEWGLRLGVGENDKYRVIPDGIEIEKFNRCFDQTKIKKEFGFLPGHLVVGAVAKLWEGKGHLDILEAAQYIINEVPNVKFLFVGEGPLRARLEREVASKHLESYVVFAGFRKDIPEITSIFDVAVLVSSFEGLGRVLLEAMILGKPVVATRVGGIPEIVHDGENGFLVSAGDPYPLASCVIKLLKDEKLRKTMGDTGRKMIDERFCSDKMVEDISKLYTELLEAKGLKR